MKGKDSGRRCVAACSQNSRFPVPAPHWCLFAAPSAQINGIGFSAAARGVAGKQNATIFAFELLFALPFSPPNDMQTAAGPAALFLLFYQQKKFTETTSRKLLPKPYPISISADFTNRF